MKRLLPLVFVLAPLIGAGQNFSTVVEDSVHYFKSELGTLVGLRVDTVAELGGNIEYFFHREFRWRHNEYTSSCDSVTPTEYEAPIDLYGPSWMGFKCVRFSDSSEVYFNYLNDSIHIRTTASLGQTWMVFRETDGSTIQARIADVLTDTVAGQSQLIKVIQLQHFNSLGDSIEGTWNGVQWQLSQFNGWKQIHSFYRFPRFEPVAYWPPEGDWNTLKRVEMQDSTIFYLYPDAIPTMGDMFDYSGGDYYQSNSYNFHLNGGFPEWNQFISNWYVLGRQDYQDSIRYVINGEPWLVHNRQLNFPNGYLPYQYYKGPSLDLNGPTFGVTAFSYESGIVVGQPVAQTNYTEDVMLDCELVGWSMNFLEGLYDDSPHDTACSCSVSCSQIEVEYYNHLIGYTYSSGCFESSNSNTVNYAQTEWCSFGHILYNWIDEQNSLDLLVYPNPATKTVRIQLPEGTQRPTQTHVYDITGRLVHQQPFTTDMDVSTLSRGTYAIVVHTEQGNYRNIFLKE